MRRQAYAAIALALSLVLVFGSYLSAAQLGEIAGQPHFNVSLGGTETLNVIILNQGQTPLPFKVVLPTLTTTYPNTTTPVVTVSPMNGSIPPASNLQIHVTVSMPLGKNKPGYTWTGVLQIVETAPTNSSGGATSAKIVAGVAKIVTVTATTEQFSLYSYAIPAVIVVAAIVAVAFVVSRRSKGKSKKVAGAGRTARSASASSKARKGRKATRKRARKGSRRTTSRTSTRKRTRTTRRRRRRTQ